MRRTLLAGLLLLVSSPVSAEEQARLTATPEQVGMGLTYTGTRVQVEAVFPAGYDVAIVCSGMPSRIELKRKGKVFGFLWMNVGDLTYENVPAFLSVKTSMPFDELAAPEVLARAGVGEGALRAALVPSGARQELGTCFGDLVQLRKNDGLLRLEEQTLRVLPAGDGRARLSAEFELPPKLVPGVYRFDLIGFRDGEPHHLASAAISAELVGAAAWLSYLAEDHGLLYGILAVIVAIAAGIVTGFLFQRRKTQRS